MDAPHRVARTACRRCNLGLRLAGVAVPGYLQYKVDPRGIGIRSGVVWRRVVSVPRSRVQHTDVSQGPIQRHLGLATLVVHTAGVVNASVTLGGLDRDIAVGIRDFLIDESLADGV